jgi:hypothetical protein
MILLACLFSRIQNGRLAWADGIRPDRLMRLHFLFYLQPTVIVPQVFFEKQVFNRCDLDCVVIFL